MNPIAETALHILVGILWWILLFPIVWILATPFILVIASFSKGSFRKEVREGYAWITDLWGDWGIFLTP